MNAPNDNPAMVLHVVLARLHPQFASNLSDEVYKPQATAGLLVYLQQVEMIRTGPVIWHSLGKRWDMSMLLVDRLLHRYHAVVPEELQRPITQTENPGGDVAPY